MIDADITSFSGGANAASRSISDMIAQASVQSRNQVASSIQSQLSLNQEGAREQLKTMLMNTERAKFNEASNRLLTSMFGKFGLMQKIMQNMG